MPSSPRLAALRRVSSQVHLRTSSRPHEVRASHAVAGLVLLGAYLAKVSLFPDPRGNSLKSGLIASSMSFLYYCALQLNFEGLTKPHVFVWRVVHGLGILYLLLLVFLNTQPYETIMDFLRLWDSDVGDSNNCKSYASDCSLTSENLKDKIFDVFFVAHLVGWFLKALILRDFKILWTCSLAFEVLEITFENSFPNFKECWWDRLLLDVFGCNLIGMIAGRALADNLKGRRFNWLGPFKPKEFLNYRWRLFSSWTRFFATTLVTTTLLMGEMNGFFLKSTFKISTMSHLNFYRLGMFVPLVYVSTHETFSWAEFSQSNLGPNAWLSITIVYSELLLCLKHSHNKEFDLRTSGPSYSLQGWTLFGVQFVLLWTVVLICHNFTLGKEGDKLLDSIRKIITFSLPLPLGYVLLCDLLA